MTDLVESQWYADRDAVFCDASHSTCEYPSPTVRDVYVEVDYYGNERLTSAARTSVIDAYANSPLAADIRMHIDTGQLGGSNSLGTEAQGTVDFDTARSKEPTNLAVARQGIFHYAVIACQDSEPGSAGALGQGEPFGDFFIVWNCAHSPARFDFDQAGSFMHELGHNLLGFRYVPSRGGTTDAVPLCGEIKLRANSALGHFTYPEAHPDCDNDGTPDWWAHSTNTADVMYQGNPADVTTVDYAGATWSALKLNKAVGGDAPPDLRCVPNLGLPIPLGLNIIPSCGLFHADAATVNLGPPSLRAGTLVASLAGALVASLFFARRRP
jgi:hypothetical protein